MSRTTSKKPGDKPVVPFSPALRYRVDRAAPLLDQSVAQTWLDIREGRLRVIREGGRTFVPGSEIVRRCSLDAQP